MYVVHFLSYKTFNRYFNWMDELLRDWFWESWNFMYDYFAPKKLYLGSTYFFRLLIMALSSIDTTYV